MQTNIKSATRLITEQMDEGTYVPGNDCSLHDLEEEDPLIIQMYDMVCLVCRWTGRCWRLLSRRRSARGREPVASTPLTLNTGGEFDEEPTINPTQTTWL